MKFKVNVGIKSFDVDIVKMMSFADVPDTCISIYCHSSTPLFSYLFFVVYKFMFDLRLLLTHYYNDMSLTIVYQMTLKQTGAMNSTTYFSYLAPPQFYNTAYRIKQLFLFICLHIHSLRYTYCHVTIEQQLCISPTPHTFSNENQSSL